MAEEKDKPYEYQHYPLALYAGGKRDGELRTVTNADEEAAARKDGFKMIDPEADKKSVAALSKKK